MENISEAKSVEGLRSEDKELYVIAQIGDNGEIVDYARGGGSSAKSYIRAFDNVASAQRSLRFLQGEFTILKVTGMEEAI